jgi:hypothetical protein
MLRSTETQAIAIDNSCTLSLVGMETGAGGLIRNRLGEPQPIMLDREEMEANTAVGGMRRCADQFSSVVHR